MTAFWYFRLTNPEDPTPLPGNVVLSHNIADIPEAEFAAAVGDRPPDVVADTNTRALAVESRGLPLGSVVYWRVDGETGEAEGWVMNTTASGQTTTPAGGAGVGRSGEKR